MNSNASIEEIHTAMTDHVDALVSAHPAAVACRSVTDVPQSGGIVDVPALTRLDGRSFVEAAFRGVLGRDADSAAMEHHLVLLARGSDKIGIVRFLSETPEGKAFGARLLGAWPEGRLRRLYRVPLLGRAARLAVSLLRVGHLRTHIQGLHDQIILMQEHNRLRELQSAADLVSLQQRDNEQCRESDEQRTLILGLVRRVTDVASHEQVVAVRRRMDNLGREHEQFQHALAALRSDVDREAWTGSVLALADRLDSVEAQAAGLHASLNEAQRLEKVISALSMAFRELRPLDAASEPDAIEVVAQAAEVLRAQVHRIRTAERATETLATSLQDQERRLSLLLETVRRRAEPLDAAQEAIMAAQQDHLLDPLYVAFEDRFRGSRQLIKERQRAHLDVIRDTGAGRSDRPIIDVGAGRGEWLELLREESLTARGIDLNVTMVEECHKRGLDCTAGDAVELLSHIPAGTIGAVTGFHIIEHLPFRVMVALFDEALRVLAPGGIALFETPNPANLLVSSRFFHLDPTHRNPLPGEMVAMVAEARGFDQVRIQPLHPMTETFLATDIELGRKLDALFHGPQDYALIARKG